jgi:hypothetical protein
MRRSEDLLDAHPLRAYDAIQLASGIIANSVLIRNGLGPLIFLAADHRLLNIAAIEGLAVDNPNQHP